MKNSILNIHKLLVGTILIISIVALSSFNTICSPTCTSCGTFNFIVAYSTGTTYEFRCGGGTNCILGTITTDATNKRVVFCNQTSTCVTLSSLSGNSCLSLNKGQTYYVHKSGSTGHYLSFEIRNQTSVTFAACFEQASNEDWSVVANGSPYTPLNAYNLTPSFIPKCLDFETCTECN